MTKVAITMACTARARAAGEESSVQVSTGTTNETCRGTEEPCCYDACPSIYTAAHDQGQSLRRYGNIWQAVGSYHSKTPHLRDAYAERIQRTVEGWRRAGYIR